MHHLKIYQHNNQNIEAVCTCQGCHGETHLSLSIEDFNRWQAGMKIQDAFPNLDADQREMLISGTCPKCWNRMFLGIDFD